MSQLDVKLSDLYTSYEAFNRLLEQPTPVLVSRDLIRIREAISTEVRHAEEARQKLLRRLEAGEISEDAADEEFQELLASTVTLPARMIPAEALEGATLSGADLLRLSWLIAGLIAGVGQSGVGQSGDGAAEAADHTATPPNV